RQHGLLDSVETRQQQITHLLMPLAEICKNLVKQFMHLGLWQGHHARANISHALPAGEPERPHQDSRSIRIQRSTRALDVDLFHFATIFASVVCSSFSAGKLNVLIVSSINRNSASEIRNANVDSAP